MSEDKKPNILTDIEECFKRIEKLESISATNNLYPSVWKVVIGKVNKLESHISKLHDLINLEDRITACDVLNRLTILEKGEMSLRIDKDMVKLDYAIYIELHKRISALEEIETNLTTRIGVLGRALNCLSEENEKLRNSVKEKCHICHGKDLCFPHCVKRESNIS